jgi:N-acetylmuramic acid 6-phosphate (MurNAc-6-P) etherase
MKAGTATKKDLNFISTTAMILSGNVHGPYMIGVECINEKLICRAQTILNRLFGMDENEAEKRLAENGYHLRETIRNITGNI